MKSATAMQLAPENRHSAADAPDMPSGEKRINCLECSAIFTPAHRRQRFCRDGCRITHWKRQNAEPDAAPRNKRSSAKDRIRGLITTVKELKLAIEEHETARVAAETKLQQHEDAETKRLETAKREEYERRLLATRALIDLADREENMRIGTSASSRSISRSRRNCSRKCLLSSSRLSSFTSSRRIRSSCRSSRAFHSRPRSDGSCMWSLTGSKSRSSCTLQIL